VLQFGISKIISWIVDGILIIASTIGLLGYDIQDGSPSATVLFGLLILIIMLDYVPRFKNKAGNGNGRN